MTPIKIEVIAAYGSTSTLVIEKDAKGSNYP